MHGQNSALTSRQAGRSYAAQGADQPASRASSKSPGTRRGDLRSDVAQGLDLEEKLLDLARLLRSSQVQSQQRDAVRDQQQQQLNARILHLEDQLQQQQRQQQQDKPRGRTSPAAAAFPPWDSDGGGALAAVLACPDMASAIQELAGRLDDLHQLVSAAHQDSCGMHDSGAHMLAQLDERLSHLEHATAAAEAARPPQHVHRRQHGTGGPSTAHQVEGGQAWGDDEEEDEEVGPSRGSAAHAEGALSRAVTGGGNLQQQELLLTAVQHKIVRLEQLIQGRLDDATATPACANVAGGGSALYHTHASLSLEEEVDQALEYSALLDVDYHHASDARRLVVVEGGLQAVRQRGDALSATCERLDAGLQDIRSHLQGQDRSSSAAGRMDDAPALLLPDQTSTHPAPYRSGSSTPPELPLTHVVPVTLHQLQQQAGAASSRRPFSGVGAAALPQRGQPDTVVHCLNAGPAVAGGGGHDSGSLTGRTVEPQGDRAKGGMSDGGGSSAERGRGQQRKARLRQLAAELKAFAASTCRQQQFPSRELATS